MWHSDDATGVATVEGTIAGTLSYTGGAMAGTFTLTAPSNQVSTNFDIFPTTAVPSLLEAHL